MICPTYFRLTLFGFGVRTFRCFSASAFGGLSPSSLQNVLVRQDSLKGRGVTTRGLNPHQVSNRPTASSKWTRDGLTRLSPSMQTALAQMGVSQLAPVQHASIESLLAGRDVVLRAMSGSGKTLAFLIPMVELLQRIPPANDADISCVVLVPTMELAEQIAVEARALMRNTELRVATMHGGTSFQKERIILNRAHRRPGRLVHKIDLLIATPDRLMAHCRSQKTGLTERFAGLRTVVIDEADLLLFHPLFRRCIEYFMREGFPNNGFRQTVLASATITLQKLTEFSEELLRPNVHVVDLVGDSAEICTNVQQKLVQASISQQPRTIYSVLHSLVSDHTLEPSKPAKVLVFTQHAALSQLWFEFCNATDLSSLATLAVLNAKQKAEARVEASDRFRQAALPQTQSAGDTQGNENNRQNVAATILFTDDVSARGMDYPDVTHVVMMGIARDRETYIHRVGRTGRMSKHGHSILITAPFERPFLNVVSDILPPPPPGPEEEHVKVEHGNDVQLLSLVASFDRVGLAVRSQAALRWLEYYVAHPFLSIEPVQVVQCGHAFASSIGLPGLPAVPAHLIRRLRIGGLPGIREIR